MMDVRRMNYHGPGWTLELDDRSYWLWAPQDGVIAIPDTTLITGERRAHWAACWQGDDGLDGDYVKGPAMADVLAIFPANIAAAFAAAVELTAVA